MFEKKKFNNEIDLLWDNIVAYYGKNVFPQSWSRTINKIEGEKIFPN